MFSTLHNQRRAEALVAEAKEAVASAREAFEEAKEALHAKLVPLDERRGHLAQKSLHRFRELFAKIENEPPVELGPVSESPFSWQIQSHLEDHAVEPVAIEEVKSGKAGAFFGSLIATLVTFVVAMAVGAVGSGLGLSPDTFTDKYKILHILEWFGGGAWHVLWANPLIGAAGLAAALLAVWLISWSIFMGKAARRNLARAEASHARALEYAQKLRQRADNFRALADELARLTDILETCDIYMQEFNATLRRIRHTEGDDYSRYKEASKAIVRRSARCASALIPMLNIALVTTEGAPSSQLARALERGDALVAALVEEKPLPESDGNTLDESGSVIEPSYMPDEKGDEATRAPAETETIASQEAEKVERKSEESEDLEEKSEEAAPPPQEEAKRP
ncbi:hypothetical protein [Hydrogenimonas sp.]